MECDLVDAKVDVAKDHVDVANNYSRGTYSCSGLHQHSIGYMNFD